MTASPPGVPPLVAPPGTALPAAPPRVPPPGSPGLPEVAVRGLTKRYGSILALDGVDLTVPAGSTFGLLGPNGAGKTTTIKILTGLAHPTRGTITVGGPDAGGIAALAGSGSATSGPGTVALVAPVVRLGYLDQEPRYYGWMTGRELLRLVARLDGLEVAELEARVGETLERVGLLGAGDRRIGGYSSGMRQRLGIAQALVARPNLLVLDEPAASLDPEGRRDVLELIAGLRDTATVIVSSHILADVERVCDRVAILDRGRLVTEGPLAELLAAHRGRSYRLVPTAGQPDAASGLATALRSRPWAGEVVASADEVRLTVADEVAAAREILPAVVGTGIELDAFERVQPTLEDVFLAVVGPPSADELDGRGFVRPRSVGERDATASAPDAPLGAAAARAGGEPRSALDGLGPLLGKELREHWRTMRLPLTAAVFALLGFSSPLLARFTPELLQSLGGGIQITLPPPTAADSVGQLLKNVGQFGLLLAIVLAMGSVASEKERGTAGMLLGHRASRAAFLLAKLVAIGVTLAIGTLVAFAAAWFYTLVLFEEPSIGGFLASAGVQWLELMAFAAVTFLGSALTRSTAAAAGLAIAMLIVLGILGIVPAVADYLPTGLGTLAAELALGRPAEPFLGPIVAVSGLIVILGLASWLAFRRQEL